MQQTIHKAKCTRGAKNARKAVRETVNKTHKRQETVRKKLRKKTWGF